MASAGIVRGEQRLRQVCKHWMRDRRRAHPLWRVDASDRVHAQVCSRRSQSRVRLSFWEAGLWLLVAEAGRQRRDEPEAMFLSIVPGWRVQPARSSRSYARARQRALARAQPKGEWEWIEQPLVPRLAPATHMPTSPDQAGVWGYRRSGVSYRGQLRYYDDDPAPEQRERLRGVATQWAEDGVVMRDWILAGRPGPCPVPWLPAQAPDFGVWVRDYVERRPPSEESYDELLELFGQLGLRV